ncbi:acyltransferase [Trichococcus shcherbakoviae]|uniref:Trimeric lpxa-like n=1 Tax=Trichococcus shcherbakoviae TaxID=2094020 RepID=A0A383TBX5_9LACT|nr:acyltransferase [Trichococcus shcherbakoviae]SYZ77872.1 Hypothetical protein TART1_0642 [Trichococcus shcherbakoviae]
MTRKRNVLEKHAKLIRILVKMSRLLPKDFYLKCLKLIRHHDNYVAMFIRYICLKNCSKSCGDNVAVFSNVYLHRIHNLEIGNNVSIHPLCYVDAAGGITIGNDVSIAHNSTLLSEEHKFGDLNRNIKDQGCEYKKTTIEDNVWISAGCRILAGAHIKSGSIIAAGAVVKNTVNSNSIMAGIPAKLIKERQ